MKLPLPAVVFYRCLLKAMANRKIEAGITIVCSGHKIDFNNDTKYAGTRPIGPMRIASGACHRDCLAGNAGSIPARPTIRDPFWRGLRGVTWIRNLVLGTGFSCFQGPRCRAPRRLQSCAKEAGKTVKTVGFFENRCHALQEAIASSVAAKAVARFRGVNLRQ